MMPCSSMIAKLVEYPASDRFDVAHGPNLDAPRLGPGKLLRDPDRFVHVPGLDQIEASENLLGLAERSVGHASAAVSDAQGFRGRRAFEHLGLDEGSLAAELVGMRKAVAHHAVSLALGQGVEQGAVGID